MTNQLFLEYYKIIDDGFYGKFILSIKRGLFSLSFLFIILISNSSYAKGKDYAVSYFGIQSGGTVLNMRSIQYGIDFISQNGGGCLVFSEGVYLTGCIHFKSDVVIQLDEGAVLLGSVNPFDYDRQNTAFDHNFSTSLALILGLNQGNIIRLHSKKLQ